MKKWLNKFGENFRPAAPKIYEIKEIIMTKILQNSAFFLESVNE